MKTQAFLIFFVLLAFCFESTAQPLNAEFTYTYDLCQTTFSFINQTTGGVPPYSYLWQAGPSTSTVPNPQIGFLSPGTYPVTLIVTDAAQAKDTVVHTVVEYLESFFNWYVHPICFGMCTGRITKGSPSSPYTYVWSTGDSSYFINNLCAGTYDLTISSTSQTCTETFMINEPPQLTITQTVTNGTCHGSDGSIDITVSGGTPPYYYQWSNGDTSQDLTGLTGGTYSVTFHDSRQCVNYTVATINDNTLGLSFSIVHPNCGASDGVVTVHPTGGSGAYSFQWAPAVGIDSVASALQAGTYFVTVTDTNGCTGIDSIALTDSCGVISGQVFEDQNGNGVKDAGEQGLSGITLLLDNGIESAVSNQSGNYYLTTPQQDTFTVSLVLPDSQYFCSGTLILPYTLTSPASGVYTVIISSGSPSSAGNDFGLLKPVSSCGTIMGYVFDDLNGNGSDDLEPRKSGIAISLSTGQYAVTDFNGMYSVEVSLNVVVTVSIVPAPSSYFCGSNQPYYVQTFPPFNGSYTVSLSTASPNSTGNDFGVQQTSPSYDVGVYTIRSFSSVSKGTFTAWMDFKAHGSNTDTCLLRVTFDPLVDFISASIQPTTVTDTYIEWTFPPGTAPDWYCMEMEFFIDEAVIEGTELIWTGTYHCGSPDGCPGNDSLTVIQTVIFDHPRQAYDNGFNFMEVEHTGDAQALTAADSCFSYSIIFQNTGDDTVYHLTIVDTLPPYLNINTVSTPFSSDAYKLYIPASNILIWEFNNILLPDSATDFQHSYGFVQYNIFMKPDLPPGTVIEQRAALSFNYNEPYLTNYVTVMLKEPDDTTSGIADLSSDVLKIYPNPGSGDFKVVLSQDARSDSRVMVYDVMGNMLMEKTLSGNSDKAIEINLEEQPEGLYFVRVVSDEDNFNGKVMLLK